ncbi:MAG: GNAT family N-acetyltransferase [Bacteroidetes bacterium HGW-Bacteroidetes-1]|jgi:ribosomal protein S18 acetylase RimI-like enzyme|nr:MAG: GNAT family N-acetyltransferase [Bacteroidetes bacterium HGW-Bacteroidetes-1]
MNFETLKFEKLDLNGVKTLVEWAREEGWNPGEKDAEVFYATDPDGHYGYFMDEEMIAGGSIISYDGVFGFMGLFIVKPYYRSLGIGRKLWYQRRDMLLSRLESGASIGMDGVVAMQSFYGKGGFESVFRDERHMKLGEIFTIDSHISSIEFSDFDAVLSYDIQCFGFPRPQFLKPWLNMQGNKNFKYVSDGQMKGFAIMRKATSGYKICPLFADNEVVAEALYKACLNAVPGEEVFLDIPLTNTAAVRLLKKYKTQYVFECARMYYGKPPELALEKVFGITTFELG